jgi:hypothetical protein
MHCIFKWRRYGEYAWLQSKQMHPVYAPGFWALICQVTFITAQKERGSSGTVCRFDLDQSFATTGMIREDIVPGAVSVFLCYPSNFSRKVDSIRLNKPVPFNIQNKSLACVAERAVTLVPLDWIKFPYESLELLWDFLITR